MITVMCFGTFDILHLGHLHYFKQAKQQGDFLVVVVARDETKKKEGKELIFSEGERLELVKSLKIVDKAVLGYLENHFRIIEENNPDVICLGYDHIISESELAEKLAELHLFPRIVRAVPYKRSQYKSSKFREMIFEK